MGYFRMGSKLKILSYEEMIWKIRDHLVHWRIIQSETDDKVGKHLNLSGYDLRGNNFSTLVRDVWTEFVSINWANENPGIATATRLWEVDFSGSDISDCDFSSCDLRRADFSNTKCSNSRFRDSNLDTASFANAEFQNTKFLECNLTEIQCRSTNFIQCEFLKSDLRKIIFSGSFSKSVFSECNLYRLSLHDSNLTGVSFSDTVFDFSFVGNVQCDYFYQNEKRLPREGKFKEGEFQRIYRKLNDFDLFFDQGITVEDTVVCNALLQQINQKHPEWGVLIDSINFRSGIPFVRFSFLDKSLSTEIEKYINGQFDTLKLITDISDQVNDMKKKILEKIDNIPETSINYHGSVTGVIHGDNGVINVNSSDQNMNISISEDTYKKLLTLTDRKQSDDNLTKKIKKKTKDELTKIYAGELSSLSKEAIQFIKQHAVEAGGDLIELLKGII